MVSRFSRSRESRRLGRVLFIVALSSLLVFSAVVSLAQHKYTVVDLGTLGGGYTYANGMNSLGQVTGTSAIFSPDNPASHAFLYKSGKMFDLGPAGENGSGTALNDVGQIVGIVSRIGERSRAVLFTHGGFVELGTMGGLSSYPYAINSSGQIIMCAEGAPEGQGFLYSTVGHYVTSLTPKITSSGCPTAINSSGQLAGGYRDSNGAHAFIYSGTTLTEIGHLGGSAWGNYSWAFGMNNRGQVVGVYSLIIDANNTRVGRGFLYSNGRSVDIGDLGGIAASASAINNRGEIVGSASTRQPPGANHAILLRPGHKMLDLNDVVPKDFGWTLTEAISISDHGQILASGHKNGVDHAFLLTPRKGRHH